MVLEKRWLFSIGNGAEIRPLEKGRKRPAIMVSEKIFQSLSPEADALLYHAYHVLYHDRVLGNKTCLKLHW